MKSLNQLEDVYKPYPGRSGPVHALVGMTLARQAGETGAIIGRNGSGTSTLMRIMAGLLDHDRGSVRAGDLVLPEDRTSWVGKAHYLSPDERSFYHRLTVRHNLDLFATLLETAPSADLIRWFCLDSLLSRRFGTLSSGQKQRVSLIRALTARGELYLLDEPTRSVDPEGVEALVRWIDSDMRGEAAIVMAFPQEDELARRADRIIHIRDGRMDA